VQSEGESREDRVAVGLGTAVERFVDMFETSAHRDAMAGQKRELGRAASEAFERREAMRGGKFADRIHPLMKVEGRETRSTVADLGNSTADLRSDVRERITCHICLLVKRRLSQEG
jgi:hypothetical protein